MYPNLEEVHRASVEITEKFEYPKNPPINCSKIWCKGTRGFLERVQKTRKSYICGQDLKTKQFWVLACLILLFFASFTGCILFWFSNTFDNIVLSKIVLREGSLAFENWRKPPVKIIVQIHIFNYTNVLEYETGEAERLHVEDLGPYTYEETLEKVNVVFNDNGTVTYQEKRSHKFLPHLSIGRKQVDKLVVPNLPLMGAASISRDSYYLTRVAMSTLLKNLNEKPFLKLPAHRFIFGYEDSLFDLAKGILSFKKEVPYDKFGIMASKSGISIDRITVNTGEYSMKSLGYVVNVNGEDNIGHWSTDECNRVSGSDGSIFPPELVREKRPLYIYQKDICRRIPLIFEKEVKIINGEVPAYKYVVPMSVFDSPESTAENQCYCDMNSFECPPQGLFNTTPCTFGAPIFLSFPHFFRADVDVIEGVSGLNPSSVHPESYVYLHPTLGFPMGGKTRLQMNIQVRKSFGMQQLDVFDDDLILPVAYAELSVDENDLPEKALNLVYLSTFTLRKIELGLQYGTLLLSLITFICLSTILCGRWRSRSRINSDSSTVYFQS